MPISHHPKPGQSADPGRPRSVGGAIHVQHQCLGWWRSRAAFLNGMIASRVARLYPASRNAIGMCSNLYVSGLSYVDCVYSGRRAARAIASLS